MIQFYSSAKEIGGDQILSVFQDKVGPFPEIQAVEFLIHTSEVICKYKKGAAFLQVYMTNGKRNVYAIEGNAL